MEKVEVSASTWIIIEANGTLIEATQIIY